MLTNLHSVTDYLQLRYDKIREEEAYRPEAYVDSHEPYGIPTIGIGCNLQSYLRLVLQTLGFDVAHAILTGAADLAEQGYIQQITNVINAQYAPNATTALRDALRPIMTARANNTVAGYPPTFYRRSAFKFDNETEAQAVFNVCVKENEDRVNEWLGAGNYLSESKERIAIVSLAYSSKRGDTDVLGSKLKDAIIYDNRAEAWYQIRYVSNGDGQHAARRYREANLFGLYDTDPSNVTEAEAKEIMRMYTRYEVYNRKLSTYERDQADKPANKPPNPIDVEVQPAAKYLINNFANGTTIDGKVIVGGGLDSYAYLAENINDQLTGTEKNDLIFGERGNDTLDGGKDTDVMIGGAGDDTYIVDKTEDVVTEAANEGTDTVKSSVTYTLRDNVDNLTLMGTENIDGIGNELGNVIKGNTGNNILEGGGGNKDTLLIALAKTIYNGKRRNVTPVDFETLRGAA